MNTLLKKYLGSLYLAAAIIAPAGASATIYEYSPTAVPDHNKNAGTITSFSVTYDDVSQVFDLEVVMTKKNGYLANGFTLAVSDGPNPKGNEHLALLYFDASEADPVLTAYVYNGKNDQSSYAMGPTLISKKDAPNGTDDISYVRNGNQATFSLRLDAGAINDHPATAGYSDDWLGLAFGEQIGLWFHPFANLSSSYNKYGELNCWDGRSGWLDISNKHTRTEVPEPATLSLLAAALCGGALRRRKSEVETA